MPPENNTGHKRRRSPMEKKKSKKQRKAKKLQTRAQSSHEDNKTADAPENTLTPTTTTCPRSNLSSKNAATYRRLEEKILAETEILHVYLRGLHSLLAQTPDVHEQHQICHANAKGIAAQYAILGDLKLELKYFGRGIELRAVDKAATIKVPELPPGLAATWADVVAAWGQPVTDRLRRENHSANLCRQIVWFVNRRFEWETVANLLSTAMVQRIEGFRRPSVPVLLLADARAARELPRSSPVLAAADVLRVGCRFDKFGLLVPISREERELREFL
ncbi:uncharacterized protein BP01DRAFT_32331 [Aspergillus saccharolyticus JOP 1030-1]|uniref:Uncharacterized protein n=1 Tax=Aspergillus saccharolyticus JOP 1030-1 TaxID=1450539 RepID=A0A318ZEH5_9EURO|nr:hypothetical protein BP01DRAFT_32331 [Aspergillus saccharolyticus JOP 1030-1]PYH45946.1 hypothetical protein BP01DRAFT_32331 [Aspergillus saccharolyticus JOP 1030-1]